MNRSEHTVAEPVADAELANSTRETLRGKMGTFSLLSTALAFNAPLAILAGFIPVVIGVGNGLGAPLVFVVLTAVILLFAVGLNAMATRMRRPGAFYAYIAQGLGKRAGLGGGFVAILLYVMLGSGTYALFAMFADHFLLTVFNVEWGNWIIWALLAWAITTALSLFNIDLSAKVLVIAMALEVAIVLLWNARVFIVGGPEGNVYNPFPEFASGSLALALVFAAVAMTGFESLQVFREETVDSRRTVPRATYLHVCILGVLYVVSSYAYIVAFGPSEAVAIGAADPAGSILSSLETYVHSSVADIASFLLLTSSFAACLAIQNVASRYMYALGRDGVLFKKLGAVNRKHGSPMIASAVCGVIMLIVLLIPIFVGLDSTGSYTILTGIGGYCMVGIWAATSVAIFVYFRRNKTSEVNTWRGAIAPALASICLTIAFVLATMFIGDLVGSVAVGIATAIGIVVIAIVGAIVGTQLKRKRPAAFEQIGNQS